MPAGYRLGMISYYQIHAVGSSVGRRSYPHAGHVEARIQFGGSPHARSSRPTMTRHALLEQPIWRPDPAHVRATRMHRFSQFVGDRSGLHFDTYEALWQWSIKNREAFWSAIWSFCGVRGSAGNTVLVDGDRLPGARWFPEARLNFAQNLLGCAAVLDLPAVVFWGEDKICRQISHRELHAQAAMTAAAVWALGLVA